LKISSDIGPETLRSVIEKADKKNMENEGEALKKVLEDYLGCPLPEAGTLYLTGTPKIDNTMKCQCPACKAKRGEL
jgi:hypothetical protein